MANLRIPRSWKKIPESGVRPEERYLSRREALTMRNVVDLGMRRVLISLTFILALTLPLPSCQTRSFEDGAGPGIEVGASFLPFDLKTLTGEVKTLSDFLSQVTLVTFCFPTCGPCNAELPHFQEFTEAYSSQGLSVVAINVIPEQDHLVEEWRSERGFTFPILVGADSGRLIEDYRLVATPLSFLLDSQGRVLARYDGYRPGQEEEIEERIRQELNVGK